MLEATSEGIWEHLRSGRHAALAGVAMPSVPAGLRLIRVSCDVPPSTLGPLHDARRRLEAVLGEAPILEQARDRVLGGLRRRLLAEPPTSEIDAVLVELGDRLAELGGRRTVLVFEAVEAADAPTLAVLGQIVLRPGWMRLPVLLLFRSRAPAGPAGTLLGALAQAESCRVVVQAAPDEPTTTVAADSLRGLGPETLTVLRAGALIGTGFEVELCAALLDATPLLVLLGLQAALDHGVPLEDRGEGRVHMPAPLVAALRAGTTPSLANYWHRRLAALLGGDTTLATNEPAQQAMAAQARDTALLVAAESPPAPDLAASEPAVSQDLAASEPAPSQDAAAATAPAAVVAPPVDRPSESTSEPQAPREAPASVPAADELPAATAELPEVAAANDVGPAAHADHAQHASHRHRRPREVAPREPQAAPQTPAPTSPPTAREPSPIQATPPAQTGATWHERARHPHAPHRHLRRHDAARAASHLNAVDEGDAAAGRYVEAAREAADEGLGAQGLAHARHALAILEHLPPTDPRRRLRIAALLERARIEWRTLGEDLQLTLAAAMATARQAQVALTPGDPPALRAELALVIAGIGYDRGDLRALEEALAALMTASQALMAAGDSRGAATLLNDQAAIYIRLGDHVRATHLLVSSRKIFESAGDDDRVAQRELGETHHLLARLPLHAPLRPGREGDALSMALDHALTAEKLLRRVGDARAVARVWETMGRIEIGKRRHDRAGQRLAAAFEVQRSLGDAIGMARTTAALADLLAESGQLRESLGVLASSIALNRGKGSPLGLGLNRQALQRLAARISGGEMAAELTRVEAALMAAEQLLGRYPLPEGVGDR
jgi:tetratricopeptide (TPR) repeat protein